MFEALHVTEKIYKEGSKYKLKERKNEIRKEGKKDNMPNTEKNKYVYCSVSTRCEFP
jgi:hypothetical protein